MGRKTSGAVEDKRKPVKIRLIDRTHSGKVVEVYKLLEDLIVDHHAGEVDHMLRNLDQAKIVLAWRYGLKPDVDKVLVLAGVRKATETDKYVFGADCDFVIGLNVEAWPKLSDDRQRMVMDHELYHAAPDLDRDGNQKIDARERLCWRIRKHAFAEHREVLDRYGADACFGLNAAGLQAVEDSDRPLLAALEQADDLIAGRAPDWREAGLEALKLYSNKIANGQLEKLRDAGVQTIGELAMRMDNLGTVWAKGFRFSDKTRQAIEDSLGEIRTESPEKAKA